MERRKKGNAKRFLSSLLAVVMILSCMPGSKLSIAAYAEENDTGLCAHHAEHTAECGYAAPAEGQPCTHEHTAECYTLGVLPGKEDAADEEIFSGDSAEENTGAELPGKEDTADEEIPSGDPAEENTGAELPGKEDTADEEIPSGDLAEENTGAELLGKEDAADEEIPSGDLAEENTRAEYSITAAKYSITATIPAEWGSPIYCYAYDSSDGTVTNGGWPGQLMTDGGNDTYSYQLNLSEWNMTSSPRVIFNDGTNQCPQNEGILLTEPGSWTIQVTGTNQYTVALDHTHNQSGAFCDNGDGTHSVCCTCGYVNVPEEHTLDESGKCTVCGAYGVAPVYEIYALVPENWYNVCCYAYDGSADNGGWPGKSMELLSNDAWHYTLDTLTHIPHVMFSSNGEEPRYPTDGRPGLELTSPGAWIFRYSTDGSAYLTQHSDKNHFFGHGSSCIVCGYTENAVAKVEISGETVFYESLSDAWNAACGAVDGKASITLLKNVELNNRLELNSNANITLDCGEYTISKENIGNFIIRSGQLTLTGGTISGTDAICVFVYGGQFTLTDGIVAATNGSAVYVEGKGSRFVMNGGAVQSTGNSYALLVDESAAQAAISGGSVNGGVCVTGENPNVKLSGGTFDSVTGHEVPVSRLLAEGYTYYDSTGAEIENDDDYGLYNVTVKAIPLKILTQPESKTITYGDAASVSVTASVSSASYQWYTLENGTEKKIPEANGAELSLAGFDAGEYQVFCRISRGGEHVDSDPVTVTVRPARVDITVTVTASDSAWGNVSGGGTYTTDDTVTVTAKAKPGYKFVRWTQNGTQVSTEAEYTFPAGYEDVTLTAVFARKKIVLRSGTVRGSVKSDVPSSGIEFGKTYTVTVTPQDGYTLVDGYFTDEKYHVNNPVHYPYKEMKLEKLSTDPATGAVTYQFTATECIPIDNDQNCDYICLYFYCAKAPTYKWFSDTVTGEATAPSPDGSTAAVPYESKYDLCADPNGTGYYELANKNDRAYLGWEVESITNAKDFTEVLGGSVRFENNKLHYTPTYQEAGKTVRIKVWPKLGDELKAEDPLTFEIEVKYSNVAKLKDVSETLNDVRQPEALADVQETVKDGSHYTAVLTWSPEASDVYGFNTVYTATLTLTPEPGYSLHSIEHPGWTWKQGTPDGGAVISKEFPATRKEKITALDTIENVMLESYTNKDGVIANHLPTTVNAATETNGAVSLTLSWNCESFDMAPNAENTFTWTATCDKSYDASGVTLTGTITVTNPNALPVNITGTDKTVTYSDGTVDVSELFTIDENAGAASYSITDGAGEGTLNGSNLTVTKVGTFTVTVQTAANGIYASGEASATLTVNPKTLTPLLGGAIEKVYDGTTNAPDGCAIVLDGIVGDDEVTATANSCTFDSADAGDRTITATGITLSGADSGNYVLSTTEVTAVGKIAKRALVITFENQTITYGDTPTEATVDSNGIITYSYEDEGNRVDGWPVNAGTYTVTATVAETVNYLSGSKSITLIINRKPIQVPEAVTGLIYNGQTQTGVESGTGYTLSENTAKDAGSYEAIATPDANHCWEDGSTEAKKITWRIARAEMENIQVNGYTGAYDGDAHGITVIGYPESVTLRYGTKDGEYDLAENPTYTNAGAYTVYYQLTSPNYETVTGSATVTIERKTVDYPVVNTGLIYNGQIQTGVKTGEGYTLDHAEGKNAGAYTATAVLNANYKWSDGKTENAVCNWSINKKEITVSITANGGVYNGKPFPATAKLDGVVENEMVAVTLIYTKEGEAIGSVMAPTDVGSYTVTAAITDSNYVLTGVNSKGFAITPADVTDAKVAVDGSYTYNGTAHTPDPMVTWDGKALVKGTDYTVSYADNVNAGTATVTVTGKGNYTGETTGKFTIDKAVITDVSSTVGSVVAPEAQGTVQSQVEDGSGYSAVIAWEPESNPYGFNAVYTATLTLTPDENHIFGELSQEGWNVSVGEDGIATLTRTFPATRKEKITSLGTIEDVTLENHTATADGVITGLPTTIIVITETGAASLPISWSCEEYDIAPNAQNTFTWTITDVGDYDASGVALTGSITVTNPNALPVSITGTDKEVTYNGSTIDVSGLFAIDENAGAASYSITGGIGEGKLNGSVLTVTKAGTFTITVHTVTQGIYAGGTADAVLTVTKGIGTGTVTIENWTYGETAKEPVSESDTNGGGNVAYTYALGDETVAMPKDVGTYTVTAHFGETDLYNECTASAEFTIVPKPITVTITPNGGVYGGEIIGAVAVLNDVAEGDTAPAVTLTYTGTANDGTKVNSIEVPSLAGTYIVTASIPEGNYALIETVTAEFQVERAQSTLTLAEVTGKTYGDEDFALEVVDGEDREIHYVSSDESVVTVDETGKVHIVGAGEAIITVTVAENSNFQSQQLTAFVGIARKPIHVTAESTEVTYGERIPDLDYTVTTEELIGEDTLTGISVTRQEGEDAGEYTVTPFQKDGANPNYDIEFITGKLTILPRDIRDAQVVLGTALTANGKEQTQTLESVTVKNSKGEDMKVTYTVAGNTAVSAGGYTMTITGTGNFTGTKEQSFAIAPAAGQPTETDADGNPVLGKGKIIVQVILEDGAPTVDVGISKTEIIELLIQSGDLAAEELAQVADGEELKIILTTSNGVSADDQSEIRDLAEEYTIGNWFDISMYKQMGEGEIVWLHETEKPIPMTIQVPDSLINTDKNVTRTFWFIRCHNGKAKFLPVRYDESDRTLSFETDRFSAYAIVYKDNASTGGNQNTATGTSPQTGDSSRVDLWFALLIVSAMGLCALFRADRKKRKMY